VVNAAHNNCLIFNILQRFKLVTVCKIEMEKEQIFNEDRNSQRVSPNA